MNFNIFFDYIQEWFWDLGFIRQDYLKKLEILEKVNVVKVITWIRRVWKSFILKQFIDNLLKNWLRKENVFYLHLEDYRLWANPDLKLLAEVFEFYITNIYKDWDFYVFLDEIQNVLNWEKFIRTINEKYWTKAHIFITGSNSNLLSSELSTLLTWRFISLQVFPFSFKDFLNFNWYKINSKIDTKKIDYFQEYITFWALPEILKINDKDTKKNYILSLVDSILFKDIIVRYKLRKTSFISALLKYVYSITCSFLSINSILKYLKQEIKTLDYETVDSYINYLKNSFLINELQAVSPKTKEILKTNRKFYSYDVGIRNIYSQNYDIEKILENYVYIELKRRWYGINVVLWKDYEIDFFATNDKEKLYIQVSYTLKDAKTYEREIKPLLKQKDNYKKIILTMDENEFEDKGIYVKNIINWSLGL